MTDKTILVLGLGGQLCFSLRFLIQWLYSEKRKKSVVPKVFWYFSISGGILLLIYSILRKDIVFILGQSAGLVVYFRNLILIRKNTNNE